MRPPTIHFRNQPLGAPKKVHDVRVDPNVHLRLGDAVAAQEFEELGLELASSAIGTVVLADRKPKVVRSSKDLREGGAGNGAPEIRQSASRFCDGDAEVTGNTSWGKSG